MIQMKPNRPFEFRDETKSQDSEITAMLKASNEALDRESILSTLVITLLSDFQETREELPIETRLALREHLNVFSGNQKKMIEDYLNTY